MWSVSVPDHEHGKLDVARARAGGRPPETALGEVVIEEQAAQIFDVHARRHTGAVGIPGHQVARVLALAQQVVRIACDQTRSFERSIWNAPPICALSR